LTCPLGRGRVGPTGGSRQRAPTLMWGSSWADDTGHRGRAPGVPAARIGRRPNRACGAVRSGRSQGKRRVGSGSGAIPGAATNPNLEVAHARDQATVAAHSRTAHLPHVRRPIPLLSHHGRSRWDGRSGVRLEGPGLPGMRRLWIGRLCPLPAGLRGLQGSRPRGDGRILFRVCERAGRAAGTAALSRHRSPRQHR
jgi:hypothetical protein